MKYFPLVWAALRRKPVRQILTLLSVTAAFVLFGMMIGFNASISHIQGLARADRIYVNSRFDGDLPFAMAAQIARVPGISHVAAQGFVGGYFQTERNRVFLFMIDGNMHKVWPELPLNSAQYGQLAAERTGAFFSQELAQRLKLKPGDILPVTSERQRADGTKLWTFKVLGIVRDIPTLPGGFAAGNLTYLNEARVASERGKADGFIALAADPAMGETIAARIDGSFANSGTPTSSDTEKDEYDLSGSGLDIPFLTLSVSGAGLFMILFLAGNSIAQSVRERIPEFAVLKTMGFSDMGVMALVFAEALLPCLTGAALGMGVAGGITAIFPRLLPPGMNLPPPYLPPSLFGLAFACALLVAALSSALPATRISRLDVATALSGR